MISSEVFTVPGFIDTHVHGAFGYDTCDMSADAIFNMAIHLPKFGVYAFCPTTMTVGQDVILKSFEAVCEAQRRLEKYDKPYARILGVHLEGPFINEAYAGVQDSSCIVRPDKGFDLINTLERDFPGLLKIVDIAPEVDGAFEFIDEFKDRYVLSIAHSKADYDTACKAFSSGVKSVTHLLNAMPSCSKRSPGILGALFDNSDVYCEIICDGIHIDKTVLKMLFKLLPEDRIIIVSDSMRGSGMPDGMYNLGTVDVEVANGRTYFGEGRGLAGSVTNISEEVQRLCEFGVEKTKIIKASTVNPLKRLGIKELDNYATISLDSSFRLIST